MITLNLPFRLQLILYILNQFKVRTYSLHGFGVCIYQAVSVGVYVVVQFYPYSVV